MRFLFEITRWDISGGGYLQSYFLKSILFLCFCLKLYLQFSEKNDWKFSKLILESIVNSLKYASVEGKNVFIDYINNFLDGCTIVCVTVEPLKTKIFFFHEKCFLPIFFWGQNNYTDIVCREKKIVEVHFCVWH